MNITDVNITYNTNVLARGEIYCNNLSFPQPNASLLDILSLVSNSVAQPFCNYVGDIAGVTHVWGSLPRIGYYIKFVCLDWFSCEPAAPDYNVTLQHWHFYINNKKINADVGTIFVQSHSNITIVFENNVN